MSELVSGIVPAEKSEFVRELIDERNSLVRQIERLTSRVMLIDTQIADAHE